MELNILLRGQSNALFFDMFGGYAAVQRDVDNLLGFDGVTNKVNLLGGGTPDADGNVTVDPGTSLLPPNNPHWLDPVNGDWTQGFTPDTDEQMLLNYVSDLPADVRAAPTAVLFMQDESDSYDPGTETTPEWMAGVRYEAGLVRTAFGQGAATVPYVFVPIPYGPSDPASMQVIRLGQEELAADPAFDGYIGTHTGDLDMDNPVNGLPDNRVIYGGPHLSQSDVAVLAARIAPTIADVFSQYALPGSPVASADGHLDDSGPQAVRVDWSPLRPTQVIVTLQDDPSASGLSPLGAEAATGLGWTIRDAGASIAATSATELPGMQVLLTFSGTVPTDAMALLYYNYGTGRIAPGSAEDTGAAYPGTGPGSPGQGDGIYDNEGLPAWSGAAGVAITSAGVHAEVSAGQSSAGTTLYEDDTLQVQGGGTVLYATVLTGAALTVSSGGGAGNTVVDGGDLVVAPGGYAEATTVSGGSMVVGGAAAFTVVSGGTETLLPAAVESGGTVLPGGTLVLSGALLLDETIGGSASIGAGSILSGSTAVLGNGAITVGDGVTLSGSFQDAGNIIFDIQGSTTPGASFTGSGSISVAGGGTLTLASANAITGTLTVDGSTLELGTFAAAGTAAIYFTGSGGTLLLDDDAPAGAIHGVTPDGGQAIELRNLAGAPTIQHAGDEVLLSAGGSTIDLDIAGSADHAIMLATIPPGADGGAYAALLTESNAPCYCAGTLIRTAAGDVQVELLAIGDRVITASGGCETIRWIGRRSVTKRLLHGQVRLLPVRFLAGSLGGGLPRRDLLVSPEHAMFLDGVLVPARCLVNGTTIFQEGRLDRVDYLHIELDRHDILLAEGAASESFYDDNDRGMFHNAAEFAALYPGARPADGFCARRVEQGVELEAIRRRLAGAAREMAAA